MYHTLETLTCEPLKYTMDSPVLFVSLCMGKSIRIQRVKTDAVIRKKISGKTGYNAMSTYGTISVELSMKKVL